MTTFEQELATLDEQSLRRELHPVSRAEGSRVTIDGKTYVNFSSNNYLGLARHPRVVEAAKAALDHWGVGATSSRLISGTTLLHQDLENELAAYLGTEAALLFPTGYQANVGVVSSLVGPGDAIVMDRLCHASLIDAALLSGARLFVYKHADPASAEAALMRAASYRRRLLVTESLFSMDGDFAPLNELLTVAKTYNAISLIDEAHAIAVWGEDGRGLLFEPAHRRTGEPATCQMHEPANRRIGVSEYRSTGVPEYRSNIHAVTPIPRHPVTPILRHSDTVIVVGTLSKALGSQGGFVAASKSTIELLVNKARSFIYTTGLSPVCAAAARTALIIAQEDPAPRRKLYELSKKLRDGLREQGWDTLSSKSQIVPILLGSPERALRFAAHLKEHGMYAPAIRPPTVRAGQCRLRFSVSSDHHEEDLQILLRTTAAWHASSIRT